MQARGWCRFSILVAGLALPLWANVASASTDAPSSAGPLLPAHGLRSVDVQLDPTPFFLRGFAPEVGLSLGRHRFYATVIAYDVPKFLAEDRGFQERRLLGALGYQIFFLGHVEGPFASLGLSLVRSRFELEATGGTHLTSTFKLTVRLGWSIVPFRALPELFVAPWVGPVVSVAPEGFAVDGRSIERRALGVSGAMQLGWRFGL
jgi:hypothetical protein